MVHLVDSSVVAAAGALSRRCSRWEPPPWRCWGRQGPPLHRALTLRLRGEGHKKLAATQGAPAFVLCCAVQLSPVGPPSVSHARIPVSGSASGKLDLKHLPSLHRRT